MEISWTPKAKNDYTLILNYLLSNWGSKEVNKFITQTNKVLKLIELNPQMFIESSKKRNVRKGFVTKHNSIFYQIKPRKKKIILLTFWDNRQNSNDLKY
ncbi:MAG: hypothetical protein GQ525_07060 [Draconibacterium sp.]|nr:hypothetical protein [Draconibacterium sp.]